MEEEQKIENVYFLKHDDKSLNKNIMTKKNIFEYKNNENENKIQNDNKNIIKNFLKSNNNKRLLIIIYFIINILFCNFGIIYSFPSNIAFNSNEIKLKVKGTGLKNILGSSFSYNLNCHSEIYIKDKLVQNYTDCHYILINDIDSEIKLIWENNVIFESISGMLNNCTDITEIDMTNFDTSSVIDMSNTFALCSSLKILKVDNLNTANVLTFENMFYNCTSLTSLNLESFTNPSAISLSKMFYGCENLEYINIKNFEEKNNMTVMQKLYPPLPGGILNYI